MSHLSRSLSDLPVSSTREDPLEKLAYGIHTVQFLREISLDILTLELLWSLELYRSVVLSRSQKDKQIILMRQLLPLTEWAVFTTTDRYVQAQWQEAIMQSKHANNVMMLWRGDTLYVFYNPLVFPNKQTTARNLQMLDSQIRRIRLQSMLKRGSNIWASPDGSRVFLKSPWFRKRAIEDANTAFWGLGIKFDTIEQITSLLTDSGYKLDSYGKYWTKPKPETRGKVPLTVGMIHRENAERIVRILHQLPLAGTALKKNVVIPKTIEHITWLQIRMTLLSQSLPVIVTSVQDLLQIYALAGYRIKKITTLCYILQSLPEKDLKREVETLTAYLTYRFGNQVIRIPRRFTSQEILLSDIRKNGINLRNLYDLRSLLVRAGFYLQSDAFDETWTR